MSAPPRPRRDIVVIGASAGGVEALRHLFGALPADLPAAVFVVVHTAPRGVTYLARILDRAGALPAAFAEDGEEVRPGRVYVAPPDHHLLVRTGHVHLSRGPKENRTRPAVNPLFRSAAVSYGERVVGVVLTGMLDNGTAGLLVVENEGGVTVVQDPEDAAFPGMPSSALDYVDADHVVPVAELASLLVRLTGEPAPTVEAELAPGRARACDEEEIMAGTRDAASGFTCPECSGALWAVTKHGLDEYVCRIGHLFSAETLLEEQAERRGDLLESALRALREEAELTRLLLERGRERGIADRRMSRHARRVEELSRVGDAIGRLSREDGPLAEAP